MDKSEKKIALFYFSELCSLSIFMIFSLSLEYLPPYVRAPVKNDESINLSYINHEIIRSSMLPIFNVGIPSIVILSSGLINRFKQKRFFVALLGLYFTVSLAFLFTNLLKSPIGRLRPDFLSRLTLGDHTISEGRRSFPSGHSSSSFGGLGYISLFLSDHFSIFDGSSRIYKIIIFLIPVLIASLVSISRIADHRHHWDDVLVGILIGCASATVGYFYYFPSTYCKVKHQAPECVEFSDGRINPCLDAV